MTSPKVSGYALPGLLFSPSIFTGAAESGPSELRMCPAGSNPCSRSNSPRSTSKYMWGELMEGNEGGWSWSEWDVNCSTRNMNVNPVSKDRAILVVGTWVDGWDAARTSIPLKCLLINKQSKESLERTQV